jgi:putative nucleotidyltransferase with HDIG domain
MNAHSARPTAWWGRLKARFEGESSPRPLALLFGILVWLTVGVLFAVNLLSQRVSVQVGDIAPRSVYAPFGVVDWAATARARAAAARAVPVIYTIDPHVLTQAEQQAHQEFALLDEYAADTAVPLQAREQAVQGALPTAVPTAVLGQILTLPPAALKQAEQDTLVILASVLGNGNGVRNTPVSLSEARSFVDELAQQEQSDAGVRLFVTSMADALIRPNTFVNQADTAARRQQAADAVPPVRILKGQQVLTQGQVVTPSDYQLLKELGLLNQGFDPWPLVGGLVASLVLVGALAAFFWHFRRWFLKETAPVVLTGLVIVVALVAAEALSGLPGAGDVIVPTAAIMLAALVDTAVATVATALLALSIGLLSNIDLTSAIVAFVGGLAGIMGVSRLSVRFDVVRVALWVGAVNVLALAGLDVMEGLSLTEAPVWHGLLGAFLDGGLAAVLAMGTTPFLEAPFGLVTAVRLVELANPNQPLLRKLLVEAPGTYQHSIMVGNLAEAAAEAVGANSLLARVGAIYHDIGKIKRPYFFIDNQFGGENPHDKLSPSLSALIISSHVRDGLELARQHHLPRAIQDFIAQHHGTTVIRYFYEKAREQDTGEGVLEEDFRYDGPKPQTKETAIVMLADASEATSRTLKNPTPAAIEQMVRRLIKERLADGQLDESHLTLKELDVVARTFTRVLTGVFHQRIEYPDQVLREMERSQGRGGVGGQPARVVRRMGGSGSGGAHRGG